MSLARSPRGLAALIITLFTALACSGEVLAPADGVECTVGKLGTGAPKFGEVNAQSCLVWSDWEYAFERAESWTLDAKANSAYVIRLVAVDAEGDTTDWEGDLTAYARNSVGDPALAAAWRAYVGGNTRTRELVLVTDRDREVSIRVESYEDYYGGYRLEVERCATRPIRDGGQLGEIVVNGGCRVSGFNGGEAEVAFVTYRASAGREPNITITRTAGNGLLRPQIGGPDLDIYGDLGSGVYQWVLPTAGPTNLDPEIPFAGMYTIAVGVTPGQTATMSVAVDQPQTAP